MCNNLHNKQKVIQICSHCKMKSIEKLSFLPNYKIILTSLAFDDYLHNYFNLHFCLSFRRPTFEFPIPAVVLQSVTNKSCLVCVKSKEYSFLVTTGPLGSMRWGEAELHHYNIRREEAKIRILKLASVFHHLPSVGPKQLCALAHLGCTREAGTS